MVFQRVLQRRIILFPRIYTDSLAGIKKESERKGTIQFENYKYVLELEHLDFSLLINDSLKSHYVSENKL